MQIGRIEIFTDFPVIDETNIIEVLKDAFARHQENFNRYNFLLNYDAGVQPIVRTKAYRPDINCECVDNVANEVTEFNLGFKWGYPITLVQRGEETGKAEAIARLNDYYETQNIKSKTQALGRFVEICGVGYTYVDISADKEESPFTVDVLDPRYTFVVRSNYYVDKRVMLGVTYRQASDGNRYFTCFTKDKRFEIQNVYDVLNGDKRKKSRESRWEEADRSGERNPLGAIPIIEWFRSYDRMGCFERQISEMDNLNLLISDFTNDVEQNTQAIWHTNDVDFPTEIVKSQDGTEVEKVKKPKSNDWVQTYTSADGKTPFVKPLAVEYDYNGMLSNIITRRSLILQKCNVPQRNDNSGGSTGIAMSDATGWSAAESAACKQQNITESCKMEEVRVVLKAIERSGDAELMAIRISDVQPNIKRQKTYEMTTKVNFFATAVSHGIHGLHALRAMNAFEDVNQVWEDSKELIEKYQSGIFDKQKSEQKDRLEADYSDQTDNSPMLNG